MPESNEAVSVTDERNGKRPTSVLSVDTDDALNAAHVLESARDMKLWAMAVGRLLAKSAQTAPSTTVLRDIRRRFSGRRRGDAEC